MKKLLLLFLISITDFVYGYSNTGGLVNNFAWVIIGVVLIYQIIKGNPRRITYVVIWFGVLVIAGINSTGIMVLLFIIGLLVPLLYGLYIEDKNESDEDVTNKDKKPQISNFTVTENNLQIKKVISTPKKYNIPYMSDKSVERMITRHVEKEMNKKKNRNSDNND